jgi:hypothetical protein
VTVPPARETTMIVDTITDRFERRPHRSGEAAKHNTCTSPLAMYEDPATRPEALTAAAKLLLSPPRVPRSWSAPPFGPYRNAWAKDLPAIAATPATWRESLTP